MTVDRRTDQEQDDDADRRVDDYARKRVNDLYVRFEHFFKVALTIMAFIGLLSTLALIAGGIAFDNRVDIGNRNRELIHRIQDQQSLIQRQRFDASYQACLRSNKSNLTIRSVLRGFDVGEKIVRRFPVVDDCQQYARRVISRGTR